MRKYNMRMAAVILMGLSVIPVSSVKAGELNTAFFEEAQQYNTVFCEAKNIGYLSDQYIAFDMDQDGKDELMVYKRDPDDGEDGNYHWKIFRESDTGEVEFVAEDDGSDVGNAGHVFELIDGRCVHDYDHKGVVSYMYDVDTYVFYEGKQLIQLVHEQTQNFNENSNTFDAPIDCYKVNGLEVSKEEGESLLNSVPEGETVDLSGDNCYSVYAGENDQYAYNDEEYIFPDSDKRYLDESDVAGMSAQELAYGRNEIYARYGRDFNAQELKDYFSGKSWYTVSYSADDFPYDSLNEYEKYNAKFLKQEEEALCPGGYVMS